MSRLATLMPARPPVVTRECRRCGCTDDDACIVEISNGVVMRTCSWVDEDLCSRCRRPGELSAAQRHEVERIVDRWGPVDVRPAFVEGHVGVALSAWASFRWTEGTRWREPQQIAVGAPVVVLDLLGNVVRVENPTRRTIA